MVSLLVARLSGDWRTAQRRAERGEKRISDILEMMASPLLVVGPAGHIIRANQAAATLLGLPASHLMGRHFRDAGWQFTTRDGHPLSPEDLSFSLALQGQDAQPIPAFVPSVGGTGKRFWVNATPLRDDQGIVIGAVISLHHRQTQQDTQEREGSWT